MGRPRKPTALKVLHGDFDKNPQRQNHNEPVTDAEPPKCPSWITGEARKEWKRVCAELSALRIIGTVDRAGLEQYAITYGLWRQSLLALKKSGGTYETEHGVSEHPNARAVRSYAEQIHKTLSQFGLTPAARTRLSVSSETPSPRMRRQRG